MTQRAGALLPSFVLCVCLLVASGCLATSIGMDEPEVRAQTDFGPPATLRVCALLDDGISPSDAQETLEDYWNQNEASKYNLSVKLVSYTSLPRSADEFFYWQIGRQVIARRIPPGCDRVMYFVSRNPLDALWSVPEALGAPEVLGEVDDDTMTRGFVVDRIASLNQVLMSPWYSPSKVARHETYHMLGCEHDLVMDQCYRHIAEAKWIENRLRSAGCYKKSGFQPFFPAFTHGGEGPILLTRSQVNFALDLDKDPWFNNFVECAQYAGLPIAQDGIMQTAWAANWTDKAIAEAHREGAQPVVAMASPVGGMRDDRTTPRSGPSAVPPSSLRRAASLTTQPASVALPQTTAADPSVGPASVTRLGEASVTTGEPPNHPQRVSPATGPVAE